MNNVEPYEIERKFLIKFPDIKLLEKQSGYKKYEIVQIYLLTDMTEERRIRKRMSCEKIEYFETIKKNISGIKRIELEKAISEEEFLHLCELADKSLKPIVKTRHCILFAQRLFEIDIYPFWNDVAIAEIELDSENDEIIFPPCINIIKEVSNDPAYKNKSLARIM